MKLSTLVLPLLALCFLLSGCASNKQATIQDRRDGVLSMRSDVLSALYELKPSVKAQINSAAGYGVFSNANIYLIFASVGGGYGVVKDNSNGKNTYMKMGELGVGLGAGVKDFRLVMVFHNKEVLDRFLTSGWSFGGQADAAAKASEKGAAVGGEAVIDNITVYQITESGLALQATVKGTKFWQDPELN